MREKTACVMRCKNESRFLPRSLERTWQVCQTCVVWDDGSTDNMDALALLTLGPAATQQQKPWGWIARSEDGTKELHWLYSPYTSNVRPRLRVHELRDKTDLNWYLLANLDATLILCLDGDEWLSKKAIREWPSAVHALSANYHIAHLPVVYLWGSESVQRCDAIYGPELPEEKRLRFPRLYTLRGVDDDHLFDMRFAWQGSHGFHCGSVPRERYRVHGDKEPRAIDLPLPIVHGGYIDEDLRQRKFEFYNRIDGNNEAEGHYFHIIQRPNKHAPGPVEFAPYFDE